MKTNWQTKKLGEVLDVLTNGVNCKQDKDGQGCRITRIETIAQAQIDFNRVGYCRLNESEKIKYKLKKGDILFSHINSVIHVGKTAIFNSEEELYHGINLLLMRTKNFLLPDYLQYFLKSLFWGNYWNKVCKQSVNQASVNQQDIKKIDISFPESLSEQKRIVKILDEAFKKIEKAKENAEKNLKNSKELFESYLQNIKGKKLKLGDFVNIRTGKLNANAMEEGGQYPFFTCAKEIFTINNYAFDCEAILLAGNNAVGDFNVKHYRGKFNAYQRTYIITAKNDNDISYRFLYFQLLKSLKEFKEKSVGAGTKFLKLGMIENLQIFLPQINEQKAIVKKLDSLSEQVKKLEAVYQKKLSDLEELKKSILSKAFSGEL